MHRTGRTLKIFTTKSVICSESVLALVEGILKFKAVVEGQSYELQAYGTTRSLENVMTDGKKEV